MLLTFLLSLVVAFGGRVLYASGYPPDPTSYLNLISQHQPLAFTTWSLWIVLDFISVPPVLALYVIFRRYSSPFATLGLVFCLFYVIYDVCVTELTSLTLVRLSQLYAIAEAAIQKSSVVAAATYAYYALPYQTVLSYAIGPIGYLLYCVPMAKSFFGRWVALFGVVVSVIGLLGSAAPLFPSSFFLGLCQFICVRAIAIWTLILGIQLMRYALRIPLLGTEFRSA
jgi:hypothetical protein